MNKLWVYIFRTRFIDSGFEYTMATSCLQPLVFPEHREVDKIDVQATPVPCIMCSSEFRGVDVTQDFLKHLLERHKLVISNVQQISNLKWSV